MPFNVTDFKSRIDGHLAHPAYFRVLFSGAVVSAEPSRNLAFLCNQAQLPGRAFATMEYTTHGPIRKVPYQNIYDDVVLSFYVREDMGVKELFQEWQNFICDNNADNEFSYFDEYYENLEKWGIIKNDISLKSSNINLIFSGNLPDECLI